jgi:hypothetical protein
LTEHSGRNSGELDGSPDRGLYEEDTLLTDIDGDGFPGTPCRPRGSALETVDGARVCNVATKIVITRKLYQLREEVAGLAPGKAGVGGNIEAARRGKI